VIDNGGDEAQLDAQVRRLHEDYVARGKAWKHRGQSTIPADPFAGDGR
jgi:hypothetical protein